MTARRDSAALAPFGYATFRMLWIASLLSNLGGLIQAVGAAWMMTTLDAPATLVALVQGSVTLPVMVLSLAAGVLADSYDRRRVMLVAQGFMALIALGLTGMALAGQLTPWSLLTFTFLIGCGTALHIPSWQASIGDVVPREHVPAAVTLNSMGFNMMRSIGPGIGGLIVATVGAAAAFAVNALSYVAIIAALYRWKPAPRDSGLPPERFGPALFAGLRYVAMSPRLIRVLLRGLLFGFGAVAVLALLPLVVSDRIGGTALTFGLSLGAFGAGAVVIALLNSRLRARFGSEVLTRAGFGGIAVCALGLGLSHWAWVNGALLLLGGASWVMTLSLFNATIQLSTPRWVVGRALAMYQTASFGGMALGSLVWGQVTERAGLSVALALAAATLVLGALVGLRHPILNLQTGDDFDPLNRFREPMLALSLQRRSGPIMIMIDYRIDTADIPEFLSIMADRRRVRLRDGAQHWVLLRDLESPNVWSESYHVPTWEDYVRHMQRRTKADADCADRLKALDRSPNGPVVHRMIERSHVPQGDDLPLRPAVPPAPE